MGTMMYEYMYDDGENQMEWGMKMRKKKRIKEHHKK